MFFQMKIMRVNGQQNFLVLVCMPCVCVCSAFIFVACPPLARTPTRPRMRTNRAVPAELVPQRRQLRRGRVLCPVRLRRWLQGPRLRPACAVRRRAVQACPRLPRLCKCCSYMSLCLVLNVFIGISFFFGSINQR